MRNTANTYNSNSNSNNNVNDYSNTNNMLSLQDFEEINLGKITLRNKIAMASMTRMRTTDGTPNDLYVEYYSQRASDCGFILSECLAVSDRGEGFPGNCQAFTEKHKEGWKKVIDEVHRKKGIIFGQIVHAGRAAAKAKLNGQ